MTCIYCKDHPIAKVNCYCRDPQKPYTKNDFCCEIADQVVPAYRKSGRSYSCTGHIAKQWGAAYEAAALLYDKIKGWM